MFTVFLTLKKTCSFKFKNVRASNNVLAMYSVTLKARVKFSHY